MVTLNKETHGPGSMTGVNLVVIAYDNRVAKKDGEVAHHYLDARIHPNDRRAAGQATLALVSKKDEKSPSGYNNSARYTTGQFQSIKEAAGANVSPLTNQAGEVVGQIYGVKADLLVSNGSLIANTKTLTPSELSVGEDEKGRDIQTQIFESMRASKAAREASKAPEAAVEEPAVEAPKAEPQAKAATKPRAAAKPRTKAAPKPVLVGAGGVEAASDEPELG